MVGPAANSSAARRPLNDSDVVSESRNLGRVTATSDDQICIWSPRAVGELPAERRIERWYQMAKKIDRQFLGAFPIPEGLENMTDDDIDDWIEEYFGIRPDRTANDELNRPEFCIMSSKILRGLRDASTQGIYA